MHIIHVHGPKLKLMYIPRRGVAKIFCKVTWHCAGMFYIEYKLRTIKLCNNCLEHPSNSARVSINCMKLQLKENTKYRHRAKRPPAQTEQNSSIANVPWLIVDWTQPPEHDKIWINLYTFEDSQLYRPVHTHVNNLNMHTSKMHRAFQANPPRKWTVCSRWWASDTWTQQNLNKRLIHLDTIGNLSGNTI